MVKVCRLLALGLVCLVSSRISYAASWSWFSEGPYGGDARAFAADPHDHAHLYLGTANGWLYETRNGGASWKRVARVGGRDDLVLKCIVVNSSDSKNLLVGAYGLDSHSDGGLYMSHDGGATWTSQTEMQGQSIRAMVAAPSDPKILVAGSLSGIYRSTDGGEHWRLISPAGDKEIHNIESLAIDPRNPAVIYAGTWHLPWKTTDGGEHWGHMKEGIIDDSDVFSIIVDPKKPTTVYLSACSGIYKSENSGAQFTKVHGIPSEARRTRALRQDPEHLGTVFAGTTEGLYRTMDAGTEWLRLTDTAMIVNDVYVDPANSQHVLLATDHRGVLESDDGGLSFRASNDGFSARQIIAYAADPIRPATLYVGVTNDKEAGGVFMSADGGLRWTQQSDGLDGRDVFSLVVAPDGTMLAGTRSGIFRLKGESWIPSGRLDGVLAQGGPARKGTAAERRRAAAPAKAPAIPARFGQVGDTVYAMVPAADGLYAATSSALLWSGNSGQSWKQVAGVGRGEWRFLAAAKSTVVTAQLKKMALSTDAGATWHPVPMPAELTQISTLAVDGSGTLWVGGREGVFLSADDGRSWDTLKGLDVKDVNGLYYDAASDRLLVTVNEWTTSAYAVRLSNKAVSSWDTGWNLKLLRPVGDHFVAATLFDGFVVQPQMRDSPFSTKW